MTFDACRSMMLSNPGYEAAVGEWLGMFLVEECASNMERRIDGDLNVTFIMPEVAKQLLVFFAEQN